MINAYSTAPTKYVISAVRQTDDDYSYYKGNTNTEFEKNWSRHTGNYQSVLQNFIKPSRKTINIYDTIRHRDEFLNKILYAFLYSSTRFKKNNVFSEFEVWYEV